MRDVDKLKDKIELTLDNRQVVSLVIGSLIVLGVVFLLGVMVGKQVGVPSVAAPQQDVLAALDQQAKPPPPKPAPRPIDPPMTFQKELTDPQPTDPAPKAELKPDFKPEPTRLVPPPAKADAKPEAKPESKAEAKLEPKPEPKAEAKPEPKPEPHVDAPAPALDQKLADAFKAAKATPKPPTVEAAVAPKPGTYTVQVAASQQKADADQVMTKLRGSGLRPYQVDADIPGRGRWYRVRVGSFPTKGDAEKYASDLKRETGMSGFVTSAVQ
jgi:DedD protein